MFKYMFSVFKQHYTHFHTLFHSHVFLHMFSNPCTKHPLIFFCPITMPIGLLVVTGMTNEPMTISSFLSWVFFEKIEMDWDHQLFFFFFFLISQYIMIHDRYFIKKDKSCGVYTDDEDSHNWTCYQCEKRFTKFMTTSC